MLIIQLCKNTSFIYHYIYIIQNYNISTNNLITYENNKPKRDEFEYLIFSEKLKYI